MRSLFKFIIGLVLMASEVSVQLVLLMVVNMVYLIYICCYTPSKMKLTNYLNMSIFVIFIVC